MDVLSDILGAIKMKASLYFTTEFTPPWGVRVPPLPRVARFHLALRGSLWVGVGDATPTRLEAGDLVVVPHGAEHTLTDAPDTPLLTLDTVLERTGFNGEETLVYSAEETAPAHANPGRPTRMLCGHLAFGDDGHHPFLAQLPASIVVRQHESATHTYLEEVFRILSHEALDHRPGRAAVLNRLSEVLFIQAVRAWAEEHAHERGLMAALLDPHLAQSLAALHARPAEDWSLATLARAAGLSRTVFAERFRALVGETAMQYLAQLRMQKAGALLRQGEATLDSIAGQVGYESTAAFCRVFKRWSGESPGAWRRRQD